MKNSKSSESTVSSLFPVPSLLHSWPGVIDPARFKTIPFRKIDEPQGWLGNMSRHSLRVPRTPQGVLFPTSEHYFQCERFNDPAIRQSILSKGSPMSCKMVAKKHRPNMVIAERTEEDLNIMRRTIRLKLENHPVLRKNLLALPSDAVIIEDSSNRGGESAVFWGMQLRDGVWKGENWLGRLWMELRLSLAGINATAGSGSDQNRSELPPS
jgi:ribA/ribD-fused uncharacterized protein